MHSEAFSKGQETAEGAWKRFHSLQGARALLRTLLACWIDSGKSSDRPKPIPRLDSAEVVSPGRLLPQVATVPDAVTLIVPSVPYRLQEHQFIACLPASHRSSFTLQTQTPAFIRLFPDDTDNMAEHVKTCVLKSSSVFAVLTTYKVPHWIPGVRTQSV